MTIHFGWPQLIYVVLLVLGLVVATLDHGKPRKPSHVGTHVLAVIIMTALIWWGGFFR